LAGSQAEVHSSIKAKEIPQLYVGCTRYLVGFTENIGIEHEKTPEIPQQKVFTQQKLGITTRCGDVVGYIYI